MPAASAAGKVLYAYAGASSAPLQSCLLTPAAAKRCTLAEALSLASAGSTVALASGARTALYAGNWTINTAHTSEAAPITIRPAPGVANVILTGNHGKTAHCQTTRCDGPVLTIGAGVHVHLADVTVEYGDNTTSGNGGGINNINGTVTISSSMFLSNTSLYNGGAIDSADGRSASLTVLGSSFVANSTRYDGGAINSGDNKGKGVLVVSVSTFSGNVATTGDGGAIDTADHGGTGSLSVSGSTFSANRSGNNGGAIDNAAGSVNVSGSTFARNTALYGGGAIDDAANTGQGTLVVATSTFSANDVTKGVGGAVGDGGKGIIRVSASTFSANVATYGGAALANSPTGSVAVAGDIFNGTCSQSGGAWDDAGYNVGNDTSCLKTGTGDVSHGAGQLSALAANGGSTATIRPLAGSPAIGVVPYNTSVALQGHPVRLCPTTDQRGDHSVAGHSCNAGAFQ